MASLITLQVRLKRVYYGWWVLLSTFFLGAAATGVFAHSNPVFYGPIKQDLGLNSTQTSLIFSLSRAEGSILGPIVGWLTDHFGPGRMIIIGGILAGLGFVVLHWVNSYWLFALVFVAVVSTGRTAGFSQSGLHAVNTWFIRRRSVAMSIFQTGSSSGGAAIVPLITLGVYSIGWRDVMLYSGMFICLIVVPLGMVVRRSPESMGIEPEGMNREGDREIPRSEGSVAKATALDFSVGEALRTRTFWIMLGATMLRVGLWGAVSLHAVEIMVWKGMEAKTAGFMIALMFLLATPTRLVFGVLGLRFPLQWLLCGGMAVTGLALVSLLLLDGDLSVYLFVILMAIGLGCTTTNWVALGNFYGRKSFGTLLGVMSTCYNICMLVSPIYAGWVFDRTESYTVVLVSFVPLYGLGALLFLIMQQPQSPGREALAGSV